MAGSLLTLGGKLLQVNGQLTQDPRCCKCGAPPTPSDCGCPNTPSPLWAYFDSFDCPGMDGLSVQLTYDAAQRIWSGQVPNPCLGLLEVICGRAGEPYNQDATDYEIKIETLFTDPANCQLSPAGDTWHFFGVVNCDPFQLCLEFSFLEFVADACGCGCGITGGSFNVCIEPERVQAAGGPQTLYSSATSSPPGKTRVRQIVHPAPPPRPPKFNPGQWLRRKLVSMGVDVSVWCANDWNAINQFTPDWWKQERNHRWMVDRMKQSAQRKRIEYSTDTIERLVTVMARRVQRFQ